MPEPLAFIVWRDSERKGEARLPGKGFPEREAKGCLSD